MIICFIDIETGGLKHYPHKAADGREIPMNPITQICGRAVDAESLEPVGRPFDCLIKFKPENCEPEALNLQGYSRERWEAEAIMPANAARFFADWLADNACIEKIGRRGKPYKTALVGGYNIQSFDLPFLQAWFKAFDKFFPADWHTIDLLHTAVQHFRLGANHPQPDNFKLATVCAALGVIPGDHSATKDCEATVKLARVLFGRAPAKAALPAAPESTATEGDDLPF